MPVYEFRCTKCHHEFEVVQPMNQKHEAACPECQSDKTERIWSIPAMQVRSDAYEMAKKDAPKQRLENWDKVRDERATRQRKATDQRELTNEYHMPAVRRRKKVTGKAKRTRRVPKRTA
jgi:putative FmdB family regulatory protein